MTFNPDEIKEITVQELKSLKDKKADFQLIDVREKKEYDLAEIGGLLIPLAEILNHADQIDKTKQVVVHCRSGRRSANAILELQRKFGFTNLFNLKGGIIAWSQEIDPSIPEY
ncbi:MAG: rhodanese-like domain-containing protein [Leptospiraceae bacterium]|nr:rhodanese-like domain-containing protein [Leptospiraceae bacterium]